MAQTFYEAIDAEVATARQAGRQLSRHEAARLVNRRNPELRQQIVQTGEQRQTPHSSSFTPSQRGSSALQQWNDAIKAEQARRPNMSRSAAAMSANRKNPGLRERILAEAN